MVRVICQNVVLRRFCRTFTFSVACYLCEAVLLKWAVQTQKRCFAHNACSRCGVRVCGCLAMTQQQPIRKVVTLMQACRLSAIARSKWLEEVVTLQKELAELAGTQLKMDKTVLMRRQPLTRIIQRWSRVSRVNNFTWFSGYVNMFAFFYHLLKKDHHASFHISELQKCLWKLCKVVDLFCENSAKLWKFADQQSAEVCNVRSSQCQ